MTYAIVQLGGKQFKIQEGDTIELERQKALNFHVLLFSKNVESLFKKNNEISISLQFIEGSCAGVNYKIFNTDQPLK